MARITLSVSDDVLEKLRERASSNGVSLAQFLGELLAKESDQGDGWSKSILELAQEISLDEGTPLWEREEAYAEHIR